MYVAQAVLENSGPQYFLYCPNVALSLYCHDLLPTSPNTALTLGQYWSYSTVVCNKATDYTIFLICCSVWWLRRDHKASLQGLADTCSPEKITGGWTSVTAVSSPVQYTATRKSIQYTATKTANKLLPNRTSAPTSICLPWAVPVWTDILISYM